MGTGDRILDGLRTQRPSCTGPGVDDFPGGPRHRLGASPGVAVAPVGNIMVSRLCRMISGGLARRVLSARGECRMIPRDSRTLGTWRSLLLLSTFVSIALTASTCAESQDAVGSAQNEDAAIERVAAAAMEALGGGIGKRSRLRAPRRPSRISKDMVVPAVELFDEQGDERAPSMLSLFDGATDLQSVIALQPKEFFRQLLDWSINVDARAGGSN